MRLPNVGYFPLGASHRNNQHCLGAVLANLRYRLLECPNGGNGSTSIPDADPSASSTRSPGRSSTSHIPADGRRVPEENASRARSEASKSATTRLATSGLTAVLLVCRTSWLSVQRGHFELIAFGVDPLAFHMCAQVTKATRVGRPGTGSWKPGPEDAGVRLHHEVVPDDHVPVHLGLVEATVQEDFLAESGRLSSRWFTNGSPMAASFVPPTMYWPVATFSLTGFRLSVRHSGGSRPALTKLTSLPCRPTRQNLFHFPA